MGEGWKGHGARGGGPPWGGGRSPWGGGRPPWWPETEPWPPQGPDAWAGMRKHFVRRVAGFIALLVAFVAGAIALTVVLVSHTARRGPAALGLVLLVVGAAVVLRGVRRFARPVADVMEAADRVAEGDYSARVRERGPREIRRLGRAFNQMTERLRTSEERRRNLLADVTHELRTPLSVIRGNLEGMVDGLYPTDVAHLAPIVDETKVMSRLLDDLQTLSTAEAGVLRLHREPVAAGELVDDAVAAFRAAADEAGVSLEGRVAEGLAELALDRVRIAEVLANLLSNALRHTPRGGSIVLAAERANDGESVELTVTDTGPGIPPDELPHVLERFAKSADSKGVGLGLAIAKSLVEAHGGEIRVESPAGAGTTVRLALQID
jgi:signal transduction histidine kinase